MAGTTTNQKLIDWVEHWREIFEPADVHWCDGTAEEYDRLAQVLVAPIVSEKGTMVAEKHNQVLFKVLRDATKPEIKAAVELMFKVCDGVAADLVATGSELWDHHFFEGLGLHQGAGEPPLYHVWFGS